MRIEGQHHGQAAAGARAAHHLLQNVLVPEMNPIKIAHGYDRRAQIAGYLLEGAKDPHAISNSNFNPSCASLTCGGRSRLVSSCGRSCEMWVKKARCGLSSSTSRTELATVECVGCGLCRRASRKRMSSPCRRPMESAGISLKSV